MKRIITISAAVTLIFMGCTKEPVAKFAYSPAHPIAGEQVNFENLSMDAESFEWNFSDGTTTNAYNPKHTFMSGGSFTVQLEAYGRKRGMDVSTAIINVYPEEPFTIYTDLAGDNGPVAVETDIVFTGEQVKFYNTTVDAVSYLWEFGDGYTSALESPVYSYDDPGTYEVTLNVFGYGSEEDSYTKTIHVIEGINSALRITVLEYFDEYPVEGASVLLFESVADWETETNPSEEVFTTPLGKCVFEGLNYQRYYVDVWEQDHDNHTLAAEDVGFIETQPLEPGFIHDFVAYVDYYEPEKKMTMTRIGKKAMAKETVSMKKSSEYREMKENKFSRER
ncbi:MAG: PKD domain-containing protein [Bacteroidales bacterium]